MLFRGEFAENKDLLLKIIGICVLCGILKHLQINFNSNTSEIAIFVCFMIIIILIVNSFSNIISISIKSISRLKNFLNIIIPILITLLLTTGNISAVSVMQPIILGMISVITTVISDFIIPVILISTIISLVSGLTDEINTNNIRRVF